MNVNSLIAMDYEIFIPLAGQKNKPNSNPIKANFQKAQMNVSSLITKDYRKYDDFVVRINKPNFVKGPKWTQTSLSQRIMKMKPPSGPKKQTQNKAYPERSRMGQFPKDQNELKIACRKIWPHPNTSQQRIFLLLFGCKRRMVWSYITLHTKKTTVLL